MFTFGSLILGLTLLCLNYEQIIHSIFLFCLVGYIRIAKSIYIHDENKWHLRHFLNFPGGSDSKAL